MNIPPFIPSQYNADQPAEPANSLTPATSLSVPEPPQYFEQPQQRRRWLYWSGGLLISISLLIYLGISSLYIYQGFSRAQSNLQTISTGIESFNDLPSLQNNLQGIKTNLLTAQRGLRLINWLRFIPTLENTLDNASILTEYGAKLIIIAERYLDLATPLFSTTTGNINQTSALKILADHQSEMQSSFDNLSDIEKKIDTIRYREPLNFMRSARTKVLEQFDQLLPFLKLVAGLGQLSPAFYSTDKDPLHYLVLVQNNMELRPTGGFIGTVGDLAIKQGHITHFTAQDVFAVDRAIKQKLPAPQPIADAFGDPTWHLRDISWNPDFPTTAKLALSLYLQTLPDDAPYLTGVIAFTPTFVEKLLTAVGSITLDKLGTLTPENITQTVEEFVEIKYAEYGYTEETRKAILNNLYETLIQRLMDNPSVNYVALAKAFSTALKEGHLLFSFPGNYELQQNANDLQWSGQLQPALDKDFVQVVDANLAALKTDSVLKRAYEYSLSVTASNTLYSELTLRYDNPGGDPLFVSDYHTFVRIYLPPGIQNINTQNFASPPGIEYGETHTIIGGFVNVPRGTSHVVRISYTPSSTVTTAYQNGQYQLLWKKQLGLPSAGLQLKIPLPTLGEQIASTHSSGQLDEDYFTLDTDLFQDFTLTITP